MLVTLFNANGALSKHVIIEQVINDTINPDITFIVNLDKTKIKFI